MKIKTIILFCICLLSFGCKEFIDVDDWTNHYGVEYQTDGVWSPVHETAIDISDMPDDFILEFKTIGVDSVSVVGNDDVEITILDQIVKDPSTHQIMNEPFETKENPETYKWNPNKYIQKFHFKTEGQKKINVKFYYIWEFPNDCSCTLVRQ